MSNDRTRQSYQNSIAKKTKDAVYTHNSLGAAYCIRHNGQWFAGGVVAGIDKKGKCITRDLSSVLHTTSESLDQNAIASVFICACTDVVTRAIDKKGKKAGPITICPTAKGQVLTISEEKIEESLEINSETFQLPEKGSLLFATFPEMYDYVKQNAKDYIFEQDSFRYFFRKFVAVVQEMHRTGKCEKIVVVCARPTQSKPGYVSWRLLACGGNVKEILEGYVRACKNILDSPKGLYILKPVHDALKVRVRLLELQDIDPNPGVSAVLLTNAEKKSSGVTVEVSTLPKTATSLQMLTNQLKCATQTALKCLGTSHRGIQILNCNKSVEPQIVSKLTVDKNDSSLLVMIPPLPPPSEPSVVISLGVPIAPPAAPATPAAPVTKRQRSIGVKYQHVFLTEGKKKKDPAPLQPSYCVCGRGEGRMIGCDGGSNCPGNNWFHLECVGLGKQKIKGAWYCDDCAVSQSKGLVKRGRVS